MAGQQSVPVTFLPLPIELELVYLSFLPVIDRIFMGQWIVE